MDNTQQLHYFQTWLNHHIIHLSVVKDSLVYWAAMSAAAESRKGGNRSLGIVFDLDEVLISTFPLRDPMMYSYFGVTAPGYCPTYEGAVDLIKTCHELSLMVFFVTARTDPMRAATVKNLEAVGLFPDILVTMKPGQEPGQFKTMARKEISQKCRIIASIGDQLTDLGDYTDVNYLIPNPFYRSGNYSS